MSRCEADHPIVWAAGEASSLARCRDVAGTWGQFVAWATTQPPPSPETMADYHALQKSEQGSLKKTDWIVGGSVAGGHRMAPAVSTRTILTVDIDVCSPEALFALEFGHGFPDGWAYCGHTTRSSTPDMPRVRLYLPLAEPITAEQYRLAALGLCEMLETSSVDEHGVQHMTVDRPATCDVARLMYAPTLCADAPHHPIHQDGEFAPVAVLEAAGRAAEAAATPAAPQPVAATLPRPAQQREAWTDDDVDRHGLAAMRAAGAVITQSPRRASEMTTHCPWHDDRSPSLDITADGKMVCRAGCKPGGQPITWLRYVAEVRRCSEADAFRFAREAAGLPPRDVSRVSPDVFDGHDTTSDRETGSEGVASPPRRWTLTPLRDLAPRHFDPASRLWGDVITRGCVTLLAGQSGLGKSTLIRHLVSAIAAGRPYLGIPTTASRIAVCDYESPEVLRENFWRAVYGDQLAAVDGVLLAETLPLLSAPGAVPALISEADEVGATMIVVDTIPAACLVEDENSNAEGQRVARLLRDLAAAGFAVLAVTHPSKGGSDVRGASALPAAVETILTWRSVDPVPDDGIDETTEILMTVKKNRVGQMGCIPVRPDGNGGFVSTADAYDDLAESDRIVLSIINGHRPGTITSADILRLAAMDGVVRRRAYRSLIRLADRRLIARPEYGVYG